MKRSLTGTLLVVMAASCYANLPILTKLAYRAQVPMLSILQWRFTFAVLLIWLLWPLWRRWVTLRGLSFKQVLTLLGLGVYFCIPAFTSVMALSRVPAMTFTLLVYTYPTQVALISFLLGERLPLTSWLAVFLATAGCALTVLGGAGEGLVIRSLGDVLWPLANALSYAIYLVVVGRLGELGTRVSSTALTMTGTLLAVSVVGLTFGVSAPTSSQGWLPLLGMATIGTAIPIAAMFGGVGRIGPTNASILATFEPLLTITLAAVLLHEKAGIAQLWGGVLILSSVVLLHASPLTRRFAARRQSAHLPD
ncbi:MAG: DMT family transporter [Chloroflexota bacterium]